MHGQRKKSKLYTRTGDGGETSLPGGRRVRKDDQRIVACGTVDELSAVLGVSSSFVPQRKIAAALQEIQNDLFSIGAELASEKRSQRRTRRVSTAHLDPARTAWLESLIDEYDARVPPLRTFILPSGTTAAAVLHLARTVTRRAERDVVALARVEAVSATILPYLNRLSDLLFVLARYVNKAARRREIPWHRDA